jgi:hypothetical protein
MSKRQRRRQQKQRRHEHLAPSKRQVALGTGLTIGATVAMGGVAQAGDFEVNNLDGANDGSCTLADCSLPDAIDDANDNPDSDFITFASGLSGTINLAADLQNIGYDPMYVYGPGAGTLTVNGQGNSIFYSNRATGYEGNPLLISGLTLTGGGNFNGGAIGSVDSTLIVGNSVISGNEAFTGGGVYSGYDGGDSYGSVLTVYNSTVSGNYAMYGGGVTSAGYDNGGILYTTLSGNYAYFGGGLDVDNFGLYTGFLHLENSTVSGNHALIVGGGVYDGREPNYHTGAGHYHIGFFSIRDSTIAGNDASYPGGGIYENDDNSPGSDYFFEGSYSYAPYTYNTIVADNTNNGFPGPDAYGVLNAAFTLVENTYGTSVNNNGGNKLGLDPQLSPLASNGGPTQTQKVAPTSPAVDAGNSYADTDQRGAQRPFDFSTIANVADASDMGAFELQASDLPTTGGPTPPRCKGKRATVFRANGRKLTGTNKRDVIVGTKKKDKINSRGGNDLVCAKGGNDTVNGGGGKDKLYGQGGKDKLKGAGGNDKLVGGGGKDKLIGGAGKDKLLGKGGNDTCVGGPGKDTEKSC